MEKELQAQQGKYKAGEDIKPMSKEQLRAAESAMVEWLQHENELGTKPVKIECAKEFDLHGLHYYVFKFKKKLFGDWLLGVCGGYEHGELEHCGHVFSNWEKYNAASAIDDAAKIVEDIRTYWMNQAKKREEFDSKLKSNNAFRTQDEIPAAEIESQFKKTESRYFLEVGEIDCPSGKIVVADPLAYLPSGKFSPVLEAHIPEGRYPVEAAIFRQDDIGIRMCTVKLKVKESKAVIYKRATATDETVIKSKDGKLEGFPVDAGLISFCDAQAAQEYRDFLDKWEKENPEGNIYDDYFAAFFADSYHKLPAYQREGGDFIQWSNPDSGNKMVMVASGFGDGFYNCYYGYDEKSEICQIIVPMVKPDIFEERRFETKP